METARQTNCLAVHACYTSCKANAEDGCSAKSGRYSQSEGYSRLQSRRVKEKHPGLSETRAIRTEAEFGLLTFVKSFENVQCYI